MSGADEVMKKIPLTDTECAFIYRKIILLFELAEGYDNAFHIFDGRISKFCKDNNFKLLPKTRVSEAHTICQNREKLILENPSGFIVFSHSGRNQLRQMIRHMRNACAHGHIRVQRYFKEEFLQFQALDSNSGKTKLLALIPRAIFKDFWEIVVGTLKFVDPK